MDRIEWAITVGSVCVSLVTAWWMYLKKKYDLRDLERLRRENEELRETLRRRV